MLYLAEGLEALSLMIHEQPPEGMGVPYNGPTWCSIDVEVPVWDAAGEHLDAVLNDLAGRIHALVRADPAARAMLRAVGAGDIVVSGPSARFGGKDTE